MKPVLVIVGPTASGKSEVAQLAAEALDGEVVSADSMQIYRGMDIGTAKVPVAQRRVVHHLIDICDPGEAYSAQIFQTMARECIRDIDSRGKTPILCGGTGFYVQAALEDMRFPKGEQTENPFREELEDYLAEHGSQALWDRLSQLDAPSASIIHPNNSKRVMRALEMASQGVSYAEQSRNIKCLDEVLPSVRFVTVKSPEALQQSIEKRVDEMFEEGLVSEVEGLMNEGFESALTAPQAIGYKEVVSALKGEYSLEEAKDLIKIATRRYAKRQRSWFRRDKLLIPVDMDTLSKAEAARFVVDRYRSAV